MQTALPALEDRLQLALDAGAIAGTWFWDVVADRFTSDRRFARCFSLDEQRMEAGVRLAEVVQSIHSDDAGRVRDLIAGALERGGRYRAEYRVRQLDGTYRWLEANGQVTLNEQGHALTFPGVLVDVHNRKLAELQQSALLELGDRLRGVVDASRIAGIAAEICGTVLGASRAGYGVVNEVHGKVDVLPDWRDRSTTSSVAGEHLQADFGPLFDALRQGKVVAIQDVGSDPSTAAVAAAFTGLRIAALLNVPLLRDGVLKAVLVVHQDVPRRWTAEEIAFVHGVADRTWAAMDAADSMTRLHTLNEGLELEVERRSTDRNRLWHLSRDVMLIARFDGTIMATNPAWENTLGWTEQDLRGRAFFELIHPEDRERTVAAASEMGGGSSFPNFENRYQHKDGSYRWISWSAAPGDGLIVAAGRDVTAAVALQAAEEQLRQSQKMEAVGQLTGGVAHDFNNLLTVISTSVALLRRPTTSDEQRTRSIDAIAKTVKRASRLTGQLLAFARRQALTPAVFDAAQNVTAVTEMIGTLIGARMQLETTLAEACFIDADPGQFDTAVVNLTVNARDAMNGAGQLHIDVRRVSQVPPIRLHPAIMGDYVAVSVTDTGQGISPGNLERIFEPFYTTKGPGHGTGLGLSQVFGFAKQSGGDVEVDSTVGQGTRFTLYFPRATQAAVADIDVAAPSVNGRRDGTVLVVEDNREVASAVTQSLNELGYATVHVVDAQLALAELDRDSQRFSVVFSDVIMAGMDGLELARAIRQRWSALPVVLTSGYSSVLSQEGDHGFEVLAKPYELDALSRALLRATTPKSAGRSPPVVARSHTIEAMMEEATSETRRQADLDSMQILDTAPEAAFDDLVRMASEVCGTPVALLSLIDRDRQWFKARVGLDATETPREHAFCAHAIQQPDRTMVVEDATQDPRFADNPLVTGATGIRFYAGAPLVSTMGHALGTLCVIAPQARELTPRQNEILLFLADEAVRRLELRRARLLDGD